eukprot:PhF_6_TR26169/c0_g1_i2/m.37161
MNEVSLSEKGVFFNPQGDFGELVPDNIGEEDENDNYITSSTCPIHFGTYIDLKATQLFQEEFMCLTNNSKILEKKVTFLFSRTKSNSQIEHDTQSLPKDVGIDEIQEVHNELICKKDAQIELMSRREKYLIDKYEKAIADKDQELKEAQEAYHTL